MKVRRPLDSDHVSAVASPALHRVEFMVFGAHFICEVIFVIVSFIFRFGLVV